MRGRHRPPPRCQGKLYLKPEFGKLLFGNLTDFAVKKYIRKRLDAGAEPGTVNRELATLSHLFTMAEKWKWIDRRPCHIEKLGENPGRIIALSDEQCDALMRAAIGDEDPDCWLFVAFGLNTSMRHSEILRARFDMIDFDNSRLYVGKAKAGARSQPMTKELVEILRREREMAADPEGWIFPSPRPKASTTGHRHRMDKPYDRAVAVAGLDRVLITPHVMRHTAITRLAMSGVDLPTIKAISGHKTLAMVMKYTHVFGTHVDSAITNIGRGIPAGQTPLKSKAKRGNAA